MVKAHLRKTGYGYYEMKTWFQLIKELHGYEPKSPIFTSEEEMERIKEHFGLDKMSYTELQNLRDMFMLYYLTPGNKKEGWFSISAMQSITAVIDYYKVAK